MDEALNIPDIPDSEVKFYPGSPKGPNPEDDPDAYGRWFVEHQPKKLLAGNDQLADLGIKKKYLRMVRDETMMNELLTSTQAFFDYDEIAPMQSYDGAPEQELFNRESYNVDDDSELP